MGMDLGRCSPGYERAMGKSLVPSSLFDRNTKELARMFQAVRQELASKLALSEVRYTGVLEGLRDVLVAAGLARNAEGFLSGGKAALGDERDRRRCAHGQGDWVAQRQP